MKIAVSLSSAGGFNLTPRDLPEMERAGLDLVWVAEGYGFDSPSVMGYIAAITKTLEIGSGVIPLYSRTPTLTAMTAAGIDSLSEGRFHLGLGSSGPQVIEGWHGVPFSSPIGRTREVIEICRQVWARNGPLVHKGSQYRIPLPAEEGTGLGKALKIINHPVRTSIPIWVAALGQKNVSLTAEVADGWMPTLFIPERANSVWGDALTQGAALRDPALAPLQITAGGPVAIGEGADAIACRERARPFVALTIGGMGAAGQNFYNQLARRYGFEAEAEKVQKLYLAGHRADAAAQVPDELLELTSLCGPPGYVADRIAAFAEAGVTHLKVDPMPLGSQRPADIVAALKELTV